jgi:hypothetical protein
MGFVLEGYSPNQQDELAIPTNGGREFHDPGQPNDFAGPNIVFQTVTHRNLEQLEMDYPLTEHLMPPYPPQAPPRQGGSGPAPSNSNNGRGSQQSTGVAAAVTPPENPNRDFSPNPSVELTSLALDGPRASRNPRNVEAARRYRENRTNRVQALQEKLHEAQEEIHRLQCQNQRLHGQIDILRETLSSRGGEMDEI